MKNGQNDIGSSDGKPGQAPAPRISRAKKPTKNKQTKQQLAAKRTADLWQNRPVPVTQVTITTQVGGFQIVRTPIKLFNKPADQLAFDEKNGQFDDSKLSNDLSKGCLWGVSLNSNRSKGEPRDVAMRRLREMYGRVGVVVADFLRLQEYEFQSRLAKGESLDTLKKELRLERQSWVASSQKELPGNNAARAVYFVWEDMLKTPGCQQARKEIDALYKSNAVFQDDVRRSMFHTHKDKPDAEKKNESARNYILEECAMLLWLRGAKEFERYQSFAYCGKWNRAMIYANFMAHKGYRCFELIEVDTDTKANIIKQEALRAKELTQGITHDVTTPPHSPPTSPPGSPRKGSWSGESKVEPYGHKVRARLVLRKEVATAEKEKAEAQRLASQAELQLKTNPTYLRSQYVEGLNMAMKNGDRDSAAWYRQELSAMRDLSFAAAPLPARQLFPQPVNHKLVRTNSTSARHPMHTGPDFFASAASPAALKNPSFGQKSSSPATVPQVFPKPTGIQGAPKGETYDTRMRTNSSSTESTSDENMSMSPSTSLESSQGSSSESPDISPAGSPSDGPSALHEHVPGLGMVKC